jgi:hypothetical protein
VSEGTKLATLTVNELPSAILKPDGLRRIKMVRLQKTFILDVWDVWILTVLRDSMGVTHS